MIEDKGTFVCIVHDIAKSVMQMPVHYRTNEQGLLYFANSLYEVVSIFERNITIP
jgi:hypothetical protein